MGGAAVETHSTGGATLGTIDALFGVDATSLPTSVRCVALVTNFNLYKGTPPLPITNETVTVTFSGLPAGARLPATAALRRIDSTHAYAKRVWLAAGSPRYPDAAEVTAEFAASALVVEELPLAVGVGAASVTFSMEAYSVAQVVLTYGAA